MNVPHKKLLSGFEMPVFGIGTWEMGGRTERNIANDDEADIEAVRRAIDVGITHIDTAEKYAAGHAEVLVGQAITSTPRKDLFLVSKAAEGTHHTPDGVKYALEESLKRLQTEYLDLYLLHTPTQDVDIKETMRGMNALKDAGLIKNIGVSNFSVKQFESAQNASHAKIVANQLHYNLAVREIEHSRALEYYQDNDVMVIAWRPLQKSAILIDGFETLSTIGKKYHKTPAQVAINWLISQENVVTISTMRNANHLKENLGAIGWSMSREDQEYLRLNFPNQQSISDAVPLMNWVW